MGTEHTTLSLESGLKIKVGDLVSTWAEGSAELEVIPAEGRVVRIVDNGPYKDYTGPNLVWCRWSVFLDNAPRLGRYTDGSIASEWIKNVVEAAP
jgi:hypothetical protein